MEQHTIKIVYAILSSLLLNISNASSFSSLEAFDERSFDAPLVKTSWPFILNIQSPYKTEVDFAESPDNSTYVVLANFTNFGANRGAVQLRLVGPSELVVSVAEVQDEPSDSESFNLTANTLLVYTVAAVGCVSLLSCVIAIVYLCVASAQDPEPVPADSSSVLTDPEPSKHPLLANATRLSSPCSTPPLHQGASPVAGSGLTNGALTRSPLFSQTPRRTASSASAGNHSRGGGGFGGPQQQPPAMAASDVAATLPRIGGSGAGVGFGPRPPPPSLAEPPHPPLLTSVASSAASAASAASFATMPRRQIARDFVDTAAYSSAQTPTRPAERYISLDANDKRYVALTGQTSLDAYAPAAYRPSNGDLVHVSPPVVASSAASSTMSPRSVLKSPGPRSQQSSSASSGGTGFGSGGTGGTGGGGTTKQLRFTHTVTMVTVSLCIVSLCCAQQMPIGAGDDNKLVRLIVRMPAGSVRSVSLFTNHTGSGWTARPAASSPLLNNYLAGSGPDCERAGCSHACLRTGAQLMCRCPVGHVQESGTPGRCAPLARCGVGFSCLNGGACRDTPDGPKCLPASFLNDCDLPCPLGHYRSRECNREAGLPKECKVCSPTCTAEEFEQSPCLGSHNRRCAPKSQLPGLSSDRAPHQGPDANLIWEDLATADAAAANSPTGLSVDIAWDSERRQQATLRRSGAFTISVTLEEMSYGVELLPVNHSVANSNGAYVSRPDLPPGEAQGTLANRCPYPLPLAFVLTSHEEPDQVSMGELDKQLPGYSPTLKACMTYTSFGNWNVASLPGIVCANPGRLTDLFSDSAQLSGHEGYLVVGQTFCNDRLQECKQCLLGCSRPISHGHPACAITTDELDDGWSPKLAECYTCCARDNCSALCDKYYTPNCKTFRCMRGSFFSYTMRPVWAPGPKSFHCHVAPKPRQLLYKATAVVTYERLSLKRTLAIEARIDSDGRPGPATRQFDSVLNATLHGGPPDTLPDVIGGGEAGILHAGRWRGGSAGQPLTNVRMAKVTRSITVWPSEPMGVTASQWNGTDCAKADKLLDGMRGDVGASASTDSTPSTFEPAPDLRVDKLTGLAYRVRRRDSQPRLQLHIDSRSSVLASLGLPEAVLVRSLIRSAVYLRPDGDWIVELAGGLKSSPGRFRLEVWDPASGGARPNRLYNFEIGLRDNHRFQLRFIVPGQPGSSVDYNRTFHLVAIDAWGTVRIVTERLSTASAAAASAGSASASSILFPRSERLHGNKLEQQQQKQKLAGQPASAALPPLYLGLLVAAAAVCLLLLGLAQLWPAPAPPPDHSPKRSHRLLFLLYALIRPAYLILFSFTALTLSLCVLAGPPVASLRVQLADFLRTARAGQALRQTELAGHMSAELARQYDHLILQRQLCVKQLNDTWLDVEANLTSMSARYLGRGEQFSELQSAVLHRMQTVADELNSDLAEFRNRFNELYSEYAQRIDSRIEHDRVTNSWWVQPVKKLYDEVRRQRSAKGVSTRPFPLWSGLQPPGSAGGGSSGPQAGRIFAQKLPRLTLDRINASVVGSLGAGSRGQPYRPYNADQMRHEFKPTKNEWTVLMDSPMELRGGAAADSAGAAGGGGDDSSGWPELTVWHLLAGSIALDALWLLHNIFASLHTAGVMLTGQPLVINCRQEGAGPNRKSNRVSAAAGRILRSTFVPRLVGGAAVLLALWLLSANLDELASPRFLDAVGFYDGLLMPARARLRLVNSGLAQHAARLNEQVVRAEERAVEARLQHYQEIIRVWHAWLSRLAGAQCAAARAYRPDAACPEWPTADGQPPKLQLSPCRLPLVTARPFTGYDPAAELDTLVAASWRLLAPTRRLAGVALWIIFYF
uniref:TNFR-Cys domain-containing protein n=1 Tax=Macrostomum lignano TaxID=282301 RepID=A0A1I8H0A3_9PLAT